MNFYGLVVFIWNWGIKPSAGEELGKYHGDLNGGEQAMLDKIHKSQEIQQAIKDVINGQCTPENSAKPWAPPSFAPLNDPLVPVLVPYDPIVFDLDGDGIETVGLKAGVKFDGNADGIKTTTGWVGKDDGMLVWDKNGNGQIDSGRELFGDQTVLENGQLATNGFAALSEQDTNQDGKVDASDANFAQFKVWQDVNGDGVSQTSELFTLAQKGIASVKVQANENGNGGTAFDGGRITHTGSFTKTDGTTGTAGNLLFNQDNFHTEFVNKIAVSDVAKTIINWKGSGFVRDLQEAAMLDAGIVDKVAAVKAATSRAAYVQAVGELLTSWAGTAQYAGFIAEAKQPIAITQVLLSGTVTHASTAYGLIARDPRDAQEAGWLDMAIKASDATRDVFRGTLSSADQGNFDAMRAEMLTPIQNLQAYEAFTGNQILTWEKIRLKAFPNEVETPLMMGGDGRPNRIEYRPLSAVFAEANFATQTKTVPGYVTLHIDGALKELGSVNFGGFFLSIRSNAAESMMGEYRLAPYLEKIDLVISADGVKLDFTKLDAAIAQQTAASKYEGAALVLDLKHIYGEILNVAGWNLDTQVGKLAALANTDADVKRAFTDVGLNLAALGQSSTAGDDIMAGNAQANYLSGDAGDDLLFGDAGADSLRGESGNDVLIGGNDADTLNGGAGNDTYVWAKGDGNDTINEYDTATGNLDSLKFSDINAADVQLSRDQYNLYATVISSGEKITIQNYFSGAAYKVEQIEFADGTKWNQAALDAAAYRGTANADYINGTSAAETFIGGKGADSLGGAAGNDTYVWAKGDGNDVISEYDTATGNLDSLKFTDINAADVQLSRDQYNLYATVISSGEKITIQNQFSGAAYKLEQIEFADGTLWNQAALDAAVYRGTANADYINGTSAAETFIGGKGADSLGGAAGNDTYVWAKGDGNDVISEYDTVSGNIDTLKLSDLQAADVQLSRDQNNLYATVIASGEKITIQNQFNGNAYKLEQIEFADGVNWNAATLNAAVYRGTAGVDYMTGSAEAETLYGFAGADNISAGGGADVLIGGKDADTLSGGAGNDTYVWAKGDGNDTISDYDTTTGNLDKIKLIDLKAADVLLSRDPSHLYVTVLFSGEKITIQNYFSTAGYKVEQIEFADGAKWNQAALDTAVYRGTAGADYISGTSMAETFVGGKGADSLSGSVGNDIYVWSKGDGNDTISEYDTVAGNLDTLKLTDLKAVDVQLSRDQNHLYATVLASGEKITIQNQFNGTAYKIEQIEFADGAKWSQAALDASVYRGTANVDYLAGTSAAETFIGGKGADSLNGSTGNDTYVWAKGDGNDTISDYDTATGNLDSLKFSDINVADMQLSRDQYNLYATVISSGERITIQNQFSGSAYKIEKIEFADGTKWNQALLDAAAYRGTANTDYIAGTSAAETFIGGKGADSLNGSTGNDTYVWAKGDGNDTISDYDTATGNLDTLKLADLKAVDVQLSRDPSHLYMTVLSSGEKITITNQFSGAAYKLEQIEFADGTKWNQAALDAAVYRGTSGADYISGTSANEIFDGGLGNDLLIGNRGGDTYLFNKLTGQDRVRDQDTSKTDIDTLQFGAGILSTDLVFKRSGSDLQVNLRASTDSLTWENFFVGTTTNTAHSSEYRIERVSFADGNTWYLDNQAGMDAFLAKVI
jgi:Ca2+-binding RTX toxin-like protein